MISDPEKQIQQAPTDLPLTNFAENAGFFGIGTAESVLVWVGLSAVVGACARWQQHSALGWFFLSLIISPVIAGVFLLSRGQGRTTCPHCHDLVDKEEIFCRTCGWMINGPGREPIE